MLTRLVITILVTLSPFATQVATSNDTVQVEWSTTALAAPQATPNTTPSTAPPPTAPPDTASAPRPTVNEFLPVERGLGECISAIPKPGCGSEARGGWRQTLVFLVILAGLAFIVWRIVASARKARRATTPTSL